MPETNPSTSAGPKPHRGRWQAHGGGTEKSVKWELDDPPTKSEMLRMLDALWLALTDTERKLRERLFDQARDFVRRCPAGGIWADLTKKFQNLKMKGGIRLDLEVKAGQSAVDD
jgi:hypothetical protein